MAEGRIAFSDGRHRDRYPDAGGAPRGPAAAAAHDRPSAWPPPGDGDTRLAHRPDVDDVDAWPAVDSVQVGCPCCTEATRIQGECEYGSATCSTVREVLIRPLHAQWAIRLGDHVARGHLRGCSWWFGYVLRTAQAAWALGAGP